MTIRRGVTWSDGKAMTPADVKYSFDLAKIATHPQHPLWQDTGLKGTKVQGQNVVFTFSGAPGYQQFDFYRFNVAIVPQHVFKSYSSKQIATDNLSDAKKIVEPVYVPVRGRRVVADDGVEEEERLVGHEGARPQGRAAVHRGHPQLVERGRAGQPPARQHRPLQQLRAEVGDRGGSSRPSSTRPRTTSEPNTTWLFPNTTKKPMNDRQFRRALAFSINMNQILSKAYQGLVNKASPTGLLPIWNKWVDQKVVKQYGFSYKPPGRRRSRPRPVPGP